MSTKKADIADPEFDDAERIINSLYLRNYKIRCFWEGLKYTDFNFAKRRQIIVDKWHISPELVNKIISRNC